MRSRDFHIIIDLASLHGNVCGNFFIDIYIYISQNKSVTLDPVYIWRKKWSKPYSPDSGLIQEYAEMQFLFSLTGIVIVLAVFSLLCSIESNCSEYKP